MSDEIKKQFDAFYLFIRTDEKYEEVQAQVHDMSIAVEQLKNTLENLESRVNQGVARTGNENKTATAEHAVRIALLDKDMNTTKDQLFNKETGLFKQFSDLRDWVSTFNRTVIVFFITSVAGALILWAVKNFR